MIIVTWMKRAASYLTPFCSDTRYATSIRFCEYAINGGRAVRGVGLRPFVCSDCGFESRWGHGCLSPVSVVFSGRCLCEEPIPRPEESYRVCVFLSVVRCSNSSAPTVNRQMWPD